jgi:eukaryotic-like serine/threonine-protein kinase
MGEVFRARDPRIGRDVAVKVLPQELAGDAVRLRRFEQEARSAGTLNHPNLVTIYDIGDEGGAPYIVMELLDGTTLRERFPASDDQLEAVLLWLAEVCDGVAAAHAAGVVHRDLKPENIIVTKSGYAKVLDFGLAKLTVAKTVTPASATAVRMTEPGMIVGTVDYMSPEQATGQPLDHRSDIFSLGSILFEALTGVAPFAADSVVETLHRIVRDEPAPLSAYRAGAPAELQRIVSKCLAKDPDERYQSAKELAIDLRAWTRGSAQADVRVRRRRWLVAAAAIALALALAGWLAATRARRGAGAQLRIEPVTTSGNVIGAAVSPDGKYVAAVISDGGMHSLWLRQIGTTQSIALVPPAAPGFWGVSFAPDGTTIDYVIKNAKDWSGTVYRIHTLGGPPRVVLTGADSGVAFSRDGAHIAWLRAGFPHPGESALMIASADGSGARALAVRKAPQLLAPLFWTTPAWSPDGSTIATPVSSGTTTRLALFDARSGAATMIGPAWTFAGPPSWLPDGRSLLLVASEGQRFRTQIWQLAVPSGEARRVTHDLGSYRTIDVTADGRAAVAVAAEIWSNVWLHAAGRAPVKIASERSDGMFGVAAGTDRVVFTVMNESATELWTAMRDGSGRQALLAGGESREFPVLTPDGRRVVCRSSGPRGASIARVDVDGTNAVRLAPASDDSTPAVSPDNRNVYFNADFGGGPALYRVGIDGGAPAAVAHFAVSRPAVSPDGRSIAAVVRVTPAAPPAIAILDARTGALVRRFAPETSGTVAMEVHWSRDGRFVLFNRPMEIARVPAAGGAVETVLALEQGTIFRFDVAPDGALVVARGALTRDAVQLTGFP